jgi:hypothetical protein
MMADNNDIEESSDIASENEYEEADQSNHEQDDDMNQVKTEGEGNAEGKKKPDPKDPHRPRRKKARRACFACQRAHLTCGMLLSIRLFMIPDILSCISMLFRMRFCITLFGSVIPIWFHKGHLLNGTLGDERPCGRCVKRGLGDQCQDGVRKKAKYLHDAPADALRPVLGPGYMTGGNNARSGPAGSPTNSTSTINTFFPSQNTSPNYSMQYSSIGHTQMPPPLPQDLSFNTQQSPISPNFQHAARPVSMHSIAGSVSGNDLRGQTAFSGPLFDPSNPALFNFDLENLNFGNTYGALEFSMLNHMSSGAAETPPNDHNGSISQQSDGGFSATGGMYNANMQSYGTMYPQQDNMMGDYAGMENPAGNPYDMRHHGLPRAFAIETSSQSFASPSTDTQQSPQASTTFEGSPPTSYSTSQNPSISSHLHSAHQRAPKRSDGKGGPLFGKRTNGDPPKPSRDPTIIYTAVVEPYPYINAFHSLISFVQKRFDSKGTLKVAKSLASIRPSFISCTKNLMNEDLIFMEKYFQRTLFEYDEYYLPRIGTPTVVCRRTGEIAACNKEFTLMSGWTRNVLLGRELNLNVNEGKSGSTSRNASASNSGKAGLSTPRPRAMEPKRDDGRPRPVLIGELMDDDSVLEFYEDFAKIAFSDSRGSIQKTCKVLKYQTRDELNAELRDLETGERKMKHGATGTLLGGRVSKIDGENGIARLQREGKMDCSYCWSVRADTFGMPMMIIMNVSFTITQSLTCRGKYG